MTTTRGDCTGTTARGLACRGLVIEGDTRCPAHGGALRVQQKRYRCTGKNQNGAPCFAKIAHEGGRCFYHPLEGTRTFAKIHSALHQCTGKTVRGSRCEGRIEVEGGRCPYHLLEPAQAAE